MLFLFIFNFFNTKFYFLEAISGGHTQMLEILLPEINAPHMTFFKTAVPSRGKLAFQLRAKLIQTHPDAYIHGHVHVLEWLLAAP